MCLVKKFAYFISRSATIFKNNHHKNFISMWLLEAIINERDSKNLVQLTIYLFFIVAPNTFVNYLRTNSITEINFNAYHYKNRDRII